MGIFKCWTMGVLTLNIKGRGSYIATHKHRITTNREMLQTIILLFMSMTAVYCADIVYYVTPLDHNTGRCNVDGETLSPCYPLQHIVRNAGLILSTEFIFLPGIHSLDDQSSNIFSNIDAVFHPYDEEEVIIECQTPDAGLLFLDNVRLQIISVNFLNCTLEYRCLTKIDYRFIYIADCIFKGSESEQNSAVMISAETELTNFTIFNCTFSSNRGAVAAMYMRFSTFKLTIIIYLHISNTKFESNRGIDYYWGALDIHNAMATVQNCLFTNNDRTITVDVSNLKIVNSTFVQNYGEALGTILVTRSIIDVDNSIFVNNSAENGGAILATNLKFETLTFKNTVFKGNLAQSQGGALSIEDETTAYIINCEFSHNLANFGGALYIQGRNNNCSIFNSTFTFNDVDSGRGGAVHCRDNKELYIQGGQFVSNTAIGGFGGFAYFSNCQLNITYVNISDNEASKGGAVYSSSSTLTFYNTTMTNNSAREDGGALFLMESKAGLLASNTKDFALQFCSNVAFGKGGAIFVTDNNCEHVIDPSECFFTILSENFYLLAFKNNSARQGPVIYGGLLDRCSSTYTYHGTIERTVHLKFSDISQYEESSQAVTSGPVRVCLCSDDHTINCTERETRFSRKRGELFHLMAIVVDQDNNPKKSLILAEPLESDLQRRENRAFTSENCTLLSYHIFTSNTTATLILHPDGYCKLSKFSSVRINITIQNCSRGFELHVDGCICERRLTNYFNVTDCDVDANSIKRVGNLWLRYGNQYLKARSDCPMDYCRMSFNKIKLLSPDELCSNNREGVLCGACQENHSIALGGSKCLQCTTSYAFIWLLLLFSLAGVVLVAFLLVFNITISHGTLNGLIFYANVVSISGLTSIPNCSIHPMLSVFLAWINLDFGVEICFYPGFDTYQKTWLQFVFPLYIWLMVGAIILASHYSSIAMKLFGSNNVAILATLFLLSYTKILKTIIMALNFSEVLQGSADNVSDQLTPYKVWTYDGNIEYLKGKHVPLVTVALTSLILFIFPYTLLLTFGQCVRSMPTKKKCVLWCIRNAAFISIMDAYHAPHSKRHRYWTGLMLLTRCILFLAFDTVYKENELIANMYSTNVILIAVFTLKLTCAMKVYKKVGINILEISFLLNLIILSATILKIGSKSNDKICKYTSASISVSMVMFLGILIYHVILKTNKARWCFRIKQFLSAKWPFKKTCAPCNEELIFPSYTAQPKVPSTTSVELRESLLSSMSNALN